MCQPIFKCKILFLFPIQNARFLMAPEKAKALLAACYALLSGRLLKSATKGMRCYELTSCKLAVCIQIYTIQFTNTIQYFRNIPFTDTQNTNSTTHGVQCYS